MNEMIDRTTHYVAAGAVMSPWWLPSLADVSEMAALLLPIAGLLWILVQFVVLVLRRK
ncbi:MAG TPA: hypothetical protein VNS34_04175 [Rhizobiaceae bacterium]|nr:hypothetical protein [Rhizobiaceae bacterium]